MADKRSIFQDVNENKPVEKPTGGGMIDGTRGSGRSALRLWLAALFALVVLMIAIGGLTRLTDSGLSITEWKPVTGALPPTNSEAWASEFEKYRSTPEFELQNSAMTLAEFRTIYWWEWSHRQLGRLIGLVWVVGFLWFLIRRQFGPGWATKTAAVGLLGGLQGVVGWWMVSSGLTGRMVDVASYRLALHLGLAFLILALLMWLILQLSRDDRTLIQARRHAETRLESHVNILGTLVFIQILLGALVAGIDAGRSFPTWPSMAGAFLPSESFDYVPYFSNFFENPALVQFNHRLVGYITAAFAGFVWWKSRRSPNVQTKRAFDWVLGGVAVQMALGVATVLTLAAVPLALAHQLVAVGVVVMVLRAKFATRYPIAQKLS